MTYRQGALVLVTLSENREHGKALFDYGPSVVVAFLDGRRREIDKANVTTECDGECADDRCTAYLERLEVTP